METLQSFKKALAPVETVLKPRAIKVAGRTSPRAPAVFTRQAVTIVGVKTSLGRFLPVSHEGHSNETYVDKVELLGKTRAEFIGRKMKGQERRAHMTLFRDLVAEHNGGNWREYFRNKFGRECVIPDQLCVACWNCSLFGGLDADAQAATFTRIRYFDTFSVEDALDCIASADSEEMGIGNQVYEDLSREGDDGKVQARGSESYHLYEYVKAGTRFPFITIIESPTLLDVAGYIHSVRRADAHGYGKYNANHGKFVTELLAVATGYPRFSVLDVLEATEKTEMGKPERTDELRGAVVSSGTIQTDGGSKPGGLQWLKFDSLGLSREPVVLFGEEINQLAAELPQAFNKYLEVLG